MAVHSNSVIAYAALRDSGALSDQESTAVREVVLRGPGTSRELDGRIAHGGRAWHPVFHRLEKRGVFVVVDERICKISGHKAMVYGYSGVTAAGPAPKKRSRAQELKEALAKLDRVRKLVSRIRDMGDLTVPIDTIERALSEP